jgi:hypothetical protein
MRRTAIIKRVFGRKYRLSSIITNAAVSKSILCIEKNGFYLKIIYYLPEELEFGIGYYLCFFIVFSKVVAETNCNQKIFWTLK